jgi:hypothetical protein
VVAVQSVQLPPPVPHAAGALPATQLPPEQQPLHAPAAQLPPGTHCPLAVAQRSPTAQSLAPLQPHLPLTHAAPAAFPAQLAHAAPPVPHDCGPCAA